MVLCDEGVLGVGDAFLDGCHAAMNITEGRCDSRDLQLGGMMLRLICFFVFGHSSVESLKRLLKTFGPFLEVVPQVSGGFKDPVSVDVKE